MKTLNISRAVEFPDALRISRCSNLPNLGPRLLFFSGGSALTDISRSLKEYTHNSVHLITPFDSGGSSQVLREAFDMPAVGDLRSRLMALADETVMGQPEIFALFTHRLPEQAPQAELQSEFCALVDGSHPLVQAVSQPMRHLILRHLGCCADRLPDEFDFRHASVGNLILAGGYFENDHALEPVLFMMSKMVAVLGTVRAVADVNLQIGAELQDGTVVVGQRHLTGKQCNALSQPIRRLFLSDGDHEIARGDVALPKRNRELIEKADLICFPPGSLYTSILANLLPDGVGRSISERQVSKVYVPSLGEDPECPGMNLSDQVGALLAALRQDAGADCPTDRLLDLVLCDAAAVDANIASHVENACGVACVRLALCDGGRADVYSPTKLCDALISLT